MQLKTRIHNLVSEQHQLQDQQGKQMRMLEASLESLLTENQKIVIETFKPCLIPPAHGKIGQSVDSSAEGIIHTLKRIRRLSQTQFEQMKDVWIENHISKLERQSDSLKRMKRKPSA